MDADYESSVVGRSSADGCVACAVDARVVHDANVNHDSWDDDRVHLGTRCVCVALPPERIRSAKRHFFEIELKFLFCPTPTICHLPQQRAVIQSPANGALETVADTLMLCQVEKTRRHSRGNTDLSFLG